MLEQARGQRKCEDVDKECVVQVVVDDDRIDITENSHQMKTKLCGALFRALGEDVKREDISSLDYIRYKLKHEGTPLSTQYVSRHEHLVQTFTTDQERSNVAIQDLETTYYQVHSRLPDDKIEKYSSLTKSKRYITKLLQSHEFCP